MTEGRIEHDVLREQAALYALGTLTASERAAFSTHLASCAECAAEVRALAPAAAALAHAVPQVDPPAALRERVLTLVAGAKDRPAARTRREATSHIAWLAATAALVAAIGLGVSTAELRSRVDILNRELVAARARADGIDRELTNTRRAAAQTQATIAVIAAPDLQRSDLRGEPVAPRASARAFWSRSRGLVFTASDLPPLPLGRTYQLWLVTEKVPLSAGLLQPDANGRVEVVMSTPADVPRPVALAVTIEPAGGVPAPTGDRYLLGTVSGL